MKKESVIYKFEAFTPMLGYNYIIHKWAYDCKYYLKDGYWCSEDDRKLFPQTENNRRMIEEEYQRIVDTKEKANKAYQNNMYCKRRSCVCKKCQKYCHCYDCTDRFLQCDNQEKEFANR